MKKINKIIAVLALMVMLLIPTGTVQAQDSSEGGKAVFGQNFTLESGKTLEGDLVVFGGNVIIEEDATINGNVAVLGGTLELAEDGVIDGDTAMIGGTMDVNGIVDGNLFVMGGHISLNETAVIHGDISTMGGDIDRDANAQVDGDVFENAPAPTVVPPAVPDIPGIPNVPAVPNVPSVPQVNVNVNPFWEVLNVLLRAVGVAVLAMLLTLFLQPQLERVSDAIIRQPVVAGGFGLLTVILAPVVLILLVVTIILIPVAAVVLFVLPLAWLFGIIALGQEIGERFTRAINQSWAPVLSTGVGTFILMLVAGYIGMIPCAGWLLPVLIGLVGIGAVIMTWFGTRAAPGTELAVQTVEVPPAS